MTGAAGQDGAGQDGAGQQWQRIWRSRPAPATGATGLADLLAADGYDNAFGHIPESAWRQMVAYWREALGITPGMSVFEIGCGAGAFLYDFHRMGCAVGGLDLSAGLIAVASSVMPDGRFRVADAADFSGGEQADVVVACGVFMYFPGQRYARSVLAAMARAARHAVLILDLPDAGRRERAIASRIAAVGGPAEYQHRYGGLEHCYYDRAELSALLAGAGYQRVRAEDVRIAGYANAPFRFDLHGLRAPLT
ncbi:MAG TPA: methyltransferase domain-containing protein [Streptosporangiaceae bacterium]